MPVTIRLPDGVEAIPYRELTLDRAPATLADLVAGLDRRYPGARAKLDSAAVNAAVNGEVILSGRDRTALADGDEVEFLVMFAGG